MSDEFIRWSRDMSTWELGRGSTRTLVRTYVCAFFRFYYVAINVYVPFIEMPRPCAIYLFIYFICFFFSLFSFAAKTIPTLLFFKMDKKNSQMYLYVYNTYYMSTSAILFQTVHICICIKIICIKTLLCILCTIHFTRF